MRTDRYVAVITSCFQTRLEDTLVMLGEIGVSAIDFYWSPHADDLAELRRDFELDLDHTNDQVEVDVEIVRKWLRKTINEAENKAKMRFRVVSLTTSLPSISNPAGPSRAKAVQCLATLVRLAELLHVPSVQIRAGRRVHYIRDSREGQIHYDGDAMGLSRLIASLQEIRTAYRKAFRRNPVAAVALEIEPGEGFLLRGVKQLQQIADKIADVEELRAWVGLNLDIGHCLILDRGRELQPSDLMKSSDSEEKLIMPILGAHISDHSVHHAADLPPGVFHRAEVFKTWLAFYFKRVPELLSKKHKRFAKSWTGHVSIELEAVGYIHQVARAHRVVSWMLAKTLENEEPRIVTAAVVFADLRKSTMATASLQQVGIRNLVKFTSRVYTAFVEGIREIYPTARLDKFIGDAAMIVLEGKEEEVAEAAIKIAQAIHGGGGALAANPDMGDVFRGIGVGHYVELAIA